jgi:hypothetical protein
MPEIERGYLQLLLRDPSLIEQSAGIEPEYFLSPLARRLFVALLGLSPEARTKAGTALAELFPEDSALIMQLTVADFGGDSFPEQNAAHAARRLKTLAIERRVKELKSGAMTPEQLQEYSRLQSELKSSVKEF